MQAIVEILSALASAGALAGGTLSVGQWLVTYLRSRAREKHTAEILKFLHDLGCANETEVQRLVKNWEPPVSVAPALREELAQLLTNLARGARFHTTQGTPLSSYLRCERLIEQLLANLQPKRRAGEPVGPGRGDWKLERFLGMGSFGEVWLGRNQRHPERRAFKFCTLPEAREWLDQEGSALYEVQKQLAGCPNVIEYIDIALDGTPYPYLVLEYVPGGSLEDWILTPKADRLALDVTELMSGIARGLAAAHRHKIYHRDVKPANVLLTAGADPDPKIADFGLSRVEPERPDEASSYSSREVVVGTRMYLPPEAADPYEPRTPAQDDVFAFGVVWYQVLTGRIERPPYDFADRLHTEGADSRTVRLLSRCLAHPVRRFADAGELLGALEVDSIPETWAVPEGCFDVSPLVREYLGSVSR
jgi:serine/threonine protein kinase